MSEHKRRLSCSECGKKTLHTKRGLNHILHLLLTLLTAGFWAIAWIILGITSAARPWNCGQCGKARL